MSRVRVPSGVFQHQEDAEMKNLSTEELRRKADEMVQDFEKLPVDSQKMVIEKFEEYARQELSKFPMFEVTPCKKP